MREFSKSLDDIFSGLIDLEKDFKPEIGLSECHNLVPLGKGYRIHTEVLDLNRRGSLGGTGKFVSDVWKDENGDVWQDHSSDTFEDN